MGQNSLEVDKRVFVAALDLGGHSGEGENVREFPGRAVIFVGDASVGAGASSLAPPIPGGETGPRPGTKSLGCLWIRGAAPCNLKAAQVFLSASSQARIAGYGRRSASSAMPVARGENRRELKT